MWNQLYDYLQEMELPNDDTLIGFTDDIALVVMTQYETTLVTVPNTALQFINTKLTFAEQFKRATEKVEKTFMALSILIPNIEEPISSKTLLSKLIQISAEAVKIDLLICEKFNKYQRSRHDQMTSKMEK